MEQLNLLQLHGREHLRLYDVFGTPTEFQLFLKDYAFNCNKTVEQKAKFGSLKKWGCTSAGCGWEVCISRRRASSDADTKLAGIPPGQWFISRFHDRHTNCFACQRKPSSRQLQLLSGLQCSILEGHSSAKTRVAHSLKVVSNVSMDNRDATLYRAIAQSKKSMDVTDDYQLLPSFLTTFADQNPGSRVCCQLDDHGRFFRSFLMIGSVVSGQDGWLPVLQCDGTHMKHERYNGVCLVLIGADGDGKNIPIAVGYVPSETIDNFVWFLANCIVSGVRFFDRALFVDRGKQLGAQQRLLSLGYVVNIKFCSFHIALNVQDRFRGVAPAIERVRTNVMKLQGATCITEFESTLEEISTAFPETRPVRGEDGKVTQQSVSQYLQQIHPVSWTRFGNFTHSSSELLYFEDHWKETPAYGASVPLFGVRTTSANEGENNALIFDGVRSQEVFLSTLAFVERASQVFSRKQGMACRWKQEHHNLTPKAAELFNTQVVKATTSTVNPVAGSTSEFTVVEPKPVASKMERLFRVDIDSASCARCSTREQRQIPCRHLLAALSHAGHSTHLMKDLFHAAYTVEQFELSFSKVKIEIPLMCDLVRDTTITPPPMYRQSGSSRFSRGAKDRAKRQRRILSKGEMPGSSMYAASATAKDAASSTQLNGMLESLASQVSGARKRKRGPYKCGLCGEADGHNAARCPNRAVADAPAGSDIIGGKYVVGSCPIALLQATRAAEVVVAPHLMNSAVV